VLLTYPNSADTRWHFDTSISSATLSAVADGVGDHERGG